MAIEKTMSHVEREIYENEISQMRREIEQLSRCCSQRGARMQIMREFMRGQPTAGLNPHSVLDVFEYYRPESIKGFDSEGVPVGRPLRGEGEK